MTLLKAFLLGCSSDVVWFLPGVLLLLLICSKDFSFENFYLSPRYMYIYLVASVFLFPLVFLCKPLLTTNCDGLFYFLSYLYICIVFELIRLICSYTKMKPLDLGEFIPFLVLVGMTVYELSVFQGTFFQNCSFLLGIVISSMVELVLVLSIFRTIGKKYCHPALKSVIVIFFVMGLIGSIINFLSEHSVN